MTLTGIMPASIIHALGTNPNKTTIKTIEFWPAIDFLYLFRYDRAIVAAKGAAAVLTERSETAHEHQAK